MIPAKVHAVLLLIASMSLPVARAAMVHPGGWHTEADLQRIRAGVAAGMEPWKSAWAAIKDHDADVNYRAA